MFMRKTYFFSRYYIYTGWHNVIAFVAVTRCFLLSLIYFHIYRDIYTLLYMLPARRRHVIFFEIHTRYICLPTYFHDTRYYYIRDIDVLHFLFQCLGYATMVACAAAPRYIAFLFCLSFFAAYFRRRYFHDIWQKDIMRGAIFGIRPLRLFFTFRADKRHVPGCLSCRHMPPQRRYLFMPSRCRAARRHAMAHWGAGAFHTLSPALRFSVIFMAYDISREKDIITPYARKICYEDSAAQRAEDMSLYWYTPLLHIVYSRDSLRSHACFLHHFCFLLFHGDMIIAFHCRYVKIFFSTFPSFSPSTLPPLSILRAAMMRVPRRYAAFHLFFLLFSSLRAWERYFSPREREEIYALSFRDMIY